MKTPKFYTCRELIASLLPASTRELLSTTAWFRSVVQLLSHEYSGAGAGFALFTSICNNPPLAAVEPWTASGNAPKKCVVPSSYRAPAAEFATEELYKKNARAFLTDHKLVLSPFGEEKIHSIAHDGPLGQLSRALWIHAVATTVKNQNFQVVPRFAVENVAMLPRTSGSEYQRAFEALVISFVRRHWPDSAHLDHAAVLN